jgi:hypothetical protein
MVDMVSMGKMGIQKRRQAKAGDGQHGHAAHITYIVGAGSERVACSPVLPVFECV